MIRFSMVLVLLLSFSLAGCAGNSQDRLGQYDAYARLVQAQVDAQRQAQPVVNATFIDSGGKPVKLVVNLPFQPQQIQQIKNDESYAFWGQVIGAAIPTVGNLGMAISTGYFNMKSNEQMWNALGQGGLGGGMVFDTSGGDVSLSNSANRFQMAGGDGSSMSVDALKTQTVEGEAAVQFGAASASGSATTSTSSSADSIQDNSARP